MFLDDFVLKCNFNIYKSKLALVYLLSREISIENIKKYRIGYIGKVIDNVNDSSEDALEFNKWLGLKGRFSTNRIVFPIYDELGNILGIETRGLDKNIYISNKYKKSVLNILNNLPDETLRYRKFYLSKAKFKGCFFGLPTTLKSIWDNKSVFITEGIFDCISLLNIYENCLSTLSANVTNSQIQWLRRYTDKVYIVFDSDKKGRSASNRLKDVLSDLYVYAIPLQGSDVNESVIQYGIKDLKKNIDYKMTQFF